MNEILPCPFCGRDEFYVETEVFAMGKSEVFIVCENCGCHGPWALVDIGEPVNDMKHIAEITKWNVRNQKVVI